MNIYVNIHTTQPTRTKEEISPIDIKVQQAKTKTPRVEQKQNTMQKVEKFTKKRGKISQNTFWSVVPWVIVSLFNLRNFVVNEMRQISNMEANIGVEKLLRH